MIFNQKFIKSIKDMTRGMQGRGRDENKKIEGTCFGFPKNAILDYPFMYIEKIFVNINLIFFRKLFNQKKNTNKTSSLLLQRTFSMIY